MGKAEAKTKQPRKLTEAEIRRIELFRKKEEGLISEGYQRKDITITLVKANFVGVLLTLPFILILLVVFIIYNGPSGFDMFSKTNPIKLFLYILIFAVSFIPLAVIHEGIHGLCWGSGAENKFKDIEFGFIKEQLTPYCTCLSPLKKVRYIFGSLMPMTFLGTGIGIAAVLTGNPLILVIAFGQIFGGSGDILVSSMLARYKTKEKDVVLLDHPTECGLVAFEK